MEKVNDAGFGLACKQAQQYLQAQGTNFMSDITGIQKYKDLAKRFYRINMIAKEDLKTNGMVTK